MSMRSPQPFTVTMWTFVQLVPTIVDGASASSVASHKRQIKFLISALIVTIVLLVAYFVWYAYSELSERRQARKQDSFAPTIDETDNDNSSSSLSAASDEENSNKINNSPVQTTALTVDDSTGTTECSFTTKVRGKTQARHHVPQCSSALSTASSPNSNQHQQPDISADNNDYSNSTSPPTQQLNQAMPRKSFSTLAQEFVRNIDFVFGTDDELDSRSIKSGSLVSGTSSICIFGDSDASSCGGSGNSRDGSVSGRRTPLGDEDDAWNEFIVFSDQAVPEDFLRSSSLSAVVAKPIAPEDYVMPNPLTVLL